jgi:hypothetical protein
MAAPSSSQIEQLIGKRIPLQLNFGSHKSALIAFQCESVGRFTAAKHFASKFFADKFLPRHFNPAAATRVVADSVKESKVSLSLHSSDGCVVSDVSRCTAQNSSADIDWAFLQISGTTTAAVATEYALLISPTDDTASIEPISLHARGLRLPTLATRPDSAPPDGASSNAPSAAAPVAAPARLGAAAESISAVNQPSTTSSSSLPAAAPIQRHQAPRKAGGGVGSRPPARVADITLKRSAAQKRGRQPPASAHAPVGQTQPLTGGPGSGREGRRGGGVGPGEGGVEKAQRVSPCPLSEESPLEPPTKEQEAPAAMAPARHQSSLRSCGLLQLGGGQALVEADDVLEL